MSQIRNARGRRDTNSGYARVLGNAELGQLISRVQATVISNGTELERLLAQRCNQIPNIDLFIEEATAGTIDEGVYICLKQVIRKSEKYNVKDPVNGKGIDPDMLVFIVERCRICKVLEIKDGDMFDTKKSEAEQRNLEIFSKEFGVKIPFVTDYFICSFNQENKQAIYEGFKGVFSYEHILTGRELCELLRINYDEIVTFRKADMRENFNYFIDELLAIDSVKEAIMERLSPNQPF